jgi:hypothetical protein
MDKIKLLVEKYKLPEAVAYEVERLLIKVSLLEIKPLKKSPMKDNPTIVDVIKAAAPIRKTTPIGEQNEQPRIKHHDDGTPYKSINASGAKYIERVPQITNIQFLINGERYTIDDPVVIEFIRNSLIKFDASYTPKRPAHAPKKSEKAVLKMAAKLLSENLPEDLVKIKYRNIGEIFKLYLHSWEDSNKHFDDVGNLLKIK